VPVSLTDLPAGHEFQPVKFVITRGISRAYRAATGDTQDQAYADSGDAVPPLALAALALGSLLEQVSLPEGSLHASESVKVRAVVREGAEVESRARLAQRSVRAGWVVSVLENEVVSAGASAVSARATVLSPGQS
jgi:hypothetical protein